MAITHHRRADPPSSAAGIDLTEPAPGVHVLRLAGAVRRVPLAEVVQRCLSESATVLVLDLSGVTTCDGEDATSLASVRAEARSRGVPVELVVSTYEVARALRFSEPDALLGAWPALEPVLSTVCGPRAVRTTTDAPTDVNGLP